jgi:hypothetical protein
MDQIPISKRNQEELMRLNGLLQQIQGQIGAIAKAIIAQVTDDDDTTPWTMNQEMTMLIRVKKQEGIAEPKAKK